MKPTFYYLILAVLLLGACSRGIDPMSNVNPLIGTGAHGHTFPGATTPFGMVQLSPDTRSGNWDACSGYHKSDSTILGFSHTHLSGTGCIDLGDILFLPSTNIIVRNEDENSFAPLSFNHENELAQPGYYCVKLNNNILVELTATTHVGVHRYRFPEEGGKIIVDLAHLLDNEKIYEAEINISSPKEITGMRCTGGWVDNQYVFFVAQFSQPFSSVELITSGKTVTNKRKIRGEKIQSILTFSDTKNNPVIVEVGISLVSIENARLNLDSETVDFDFDKIKKETQSKWAEALSSYKISGGTPDERVNFYTSVYHTLMAPNIISDVNGDYRGADLKIHNSPSKKVYSTLSLWDTYRVWNPLMTITDLDLVNNIINSMLSFYNQTGELPLWPLSSGETGTMIGYHSVSVIWDAYNNGIRGFDAKKALEAMVVSAKKNKKGTTPFLDLGFIPADLRRESVSCLLENAYDDWCISQMANTLGDTAVSNHFSERAMLYKNVFDGSTGFFRGRLRDGLWESPFNPYEVGRAYTEATAWQYRFSVPHDVNGMINLFGGVTHFTQALDSLFNTNIKTEGHLSDITGLIGQYAHGNEPSHHIAYLYSYANQPWKTQQMVRRILGELYEATLEGIVGNEDCGQMSAWYILSSLGFYPVCPGSSQFILTSPLFEKSVIRLTNGKTLEIEANDPSHNVYIKEVRLNNKVVNKNYITYSQIMKGGKLRFILDSKPNLLREITPETQPFSISSNKEVSVPYVSNDISFFEKEVAISCGCATSGAEIRYTLNDTEPSEKSSLYSSPIIVNRTKTIRLKAFKEGFNASATAKYIATKTEYLQPVLLKKLKNGVNYSSYEGAFSQTADILETGTLLHKGVCNEPTLSVTELPDHFGIIFKGYLLVPETGVYSFVTRSDDGSKLFINNTLVVDNDGSHGEIAASGRIALEKGLHPYVLYYFEDYEEESFSWSWKLPGADNYQKIPDNSLFIK